MKKLILPAICLLIAFVFTGATTSKLPAKDNCGPDIFFYNNSTATVTKVELKFTATNDTYTYNNPTFPIFYTGSGGPCRVTYYFSAPRTGTVGWDNGTDCDSKFYLADQDPYIEFNAGCYTYTVANGWDNCD